MWIAHLRNEVMHNRQLFSDVWQMWFSLGRFPICLAYRSGFYELFGISAFQIIQGLCSPPTQPSSKVLLSPYFSPQTLSLNQTLIHV